MAGVHRYAGIAADDGFEADQTIRTDSFACWLEVKPLCHCLAFVFHRRSWGKDAFKEIASTGRYAVRILAFVHSLPFKDVLSVRQLVDFGVGEWVGSGDGSGGG